MSCLRSWSLPAAVLAAVVMGPAVGAADDLLAKDPYGKLATPFYRLSAAAGRGEMTRSLARRHVDPSNGLVTAVAMLEHGTDTRLVERDVRDAGGTVGAVAEDRMLVHLPVSALGRVSRLPDVRFLRPPLRPFVDGVTSEGVASIRAAGFTSRTGAEGAGIKVGVLDYGFEGADALVGSELPADTVFANRLAPPAGSGRHGTACAELVHDVAPGAQVVLAQFNDEVRWRQAADQLRAQGVQVISSSISFPNSEEADGVGYFASYVDAFSQAGILWVNSAGNSGQRFHRGAGADVDGDKLLEFGGTEMVPIATHDGEISVSVLWNYAQGMAASDDYDLLVVTAGFRDDPRPAADNPSVVASSANPQQDGRGYPWEGVDFESAERELYAVVVKRTERAAPAGRTFSIWTSGQVLGGLATPQASLGPPADARGALTVGAVDHASLDLRGYSSRGPAIDGRVKPDLAGPDGVTTASWPMFLGTSAATPHIAGAAALVWSRNPALTAAEVRRLLESAGSLGGRKDNDTGYGVLQLDRVP